MRVTFKPPKDRKVHVYCLGCGHEGVDSSSPGGQLYYTCRACGQLDVRALIIHPAVNWWLDKTLEYWHEVSGVFVCNDERKFLFFERTRFPPGLTIPAGHVDRRERPELAAVRELREETGIRRSQLTHIATDDIRGDECRRGSDAHRWHTFVVRVPSSISVKVDRREGVRPVWLSLEQALCRNLTFVARYVITNHADAITSVLR